MAQHSFVTTDLTPGSVAYMGHASKYVNASYDPQPDITAYELATILPFFMSRIMTEADWDAFGAAQRHLKRLGCAEAAA